MDMARDKLNTFHDDDYTVHNFVDFCHLHHPAFSPMYDVQEKFQKFILGLSYWLKRAEWRAENQKFKTVKDLIDEFNSFGQPKQQLVAATAATPAVVLPTLGDDKPKLTLKAAHAQVHPTDHHNDSKDAADGNHHKGHKDGHDDHNGHGRRRGSKEATESNEEFGGDLKSNKSDTLDAPEPSRSNDNEKFAGYVMPHHKDVPHAHVQSNFHSVASVEMHRSKCRIDEHFNLVLLFLLI
jgi:hypothetical protein